MVLQETSTPMAKKEQKMGATDFRKAIIEIFIGNFCTKLGLFE
jgi:hypothetical protein